MHLRGFSLSNIELAVAGVVYDLHNNFDFIGFSYDVANRSLLLRWKRGAGTWVPADSPASIEISMLEVSHVSASPRSPDLPYTEDDCLDCVSFVEPNQATEECFVTESPIPPETHYVFQFMSGFALRVQAEEAVCKVA